MRSVVGSHRDSGEGLTQFIIKKMAQRTKESFKSTNNSRHPDNTTGLVQPSHVRSMFEDAADSFAFAGEVEDIASLDTYSRHNEDFLGSPSNSLSLGGFNNGGGVGLSPATSVFGVDNTEKAAGVLVCSTGTSTAGGSTLNDVTYQATFGFGYEYTLTWRAALETLSDGTETYKVRIGFLDSVSSATPTDGAYFRYTHSANGGRWEAVTVSNSTETAEDTGIAADVTTYHIFKVFVNSDATQVDFYIDGVKTNDITTNIINSSARLTGKVLTIEKTAGSTARTLYCDYYDFLATRTTAR